MTPYLNRLDETVLMVGHKKCFYGEMWLIIPELSMLLFLIWSSALSSNTFQDTCTKCTLLTSLKCQNCRRPKTLKIIKRNLFKIIQSTYIHVIFSQSQIGRFGISQREIGVSDREIFAR